jgi:hypothetical protein
MVIGDGNGAATTPLETQTGLVHAVATVPITSVVRDGNKVTIDAVLDTNTGGWTIREAGVLDEDGQLLFVASVPETEKLTEALGAFDELTLGLIVIVSETAQITLSPLPGSLISIAQLLRAPWITVDSMTVTAPPGAPTEGMTYLVPSGATGAWVGRTHEIVQWNGIGWVFKSVPVTHLIAAADTGKYFARTASGWQEVFLPRVRVDEAALLFFGCF